MKMIALAMVCTVVATATSFDARAQTRNDTKLVFLGNKNIAPIVYLDESAPSGVAVDIVRAMEKYLRHPVEIRAMDWPEAQALVARGEADALIQINRNAEREKIYDFSDTLLESQFSIFTAADNIGISGVSSLRGLRVGVEAGGLPHQTLEKTPHILLRIIPNFIDGFKLLSVHALDAVVVDYRVGAYVIARNKIKNIKVSGEPIAYSYSSIAVRKGNIALINDINNALSVMKHDGTYQNIINSWKPTEVVFQTREQISRENYMAAIVAMIFLLVIALVWLMTMRGELAKRKRTEELLAEKHSTLRGIIDSANALIFSIDRRYRYTSFNAGHAAAMKELYGARIELGATLLDYMTVPEDRDTAKRNLDRALAGEMIVEEAYSGEELRSRRYFQVSNSPIRSGEEVIGVAVLAQDITARKQSEEAQHRLNRELRAVSDCNQTLMRVEDEQTLLDTICRIICDEAGYRMTWVGYAEHDDAKTIRPVARAGAETAYLEQAGQSWADTERQPSPTATAIRSGETACIQDFGVVPPSAPWRDGALRHGNRSAIALPLKDESDATFGALTICSSEANAFTADERRLLEELSRDLAFGITVLRARVEHKEAERQLRASVDTLSRMNAELERFAHITSHDLQEPVRTVVSFSQMLQRHLGGGLDATATEYLGFIVNGARRMGDLVHDLLSYTRMSNRQAAHLAVDLDAVVADARDNLRSLIDEREVEFDLGALPRITGDRILLIELFQNLIGNAIKFTPYDRRPQVTISARPDGDMWRLTVADQGIGIAPAYHQRIFDIFQRLHAGTAYPGTGIGLSVCKGIVEQHGGRIWVESEEGRGATFHFTLRAAGAVAPAAPEC